MINSRATDCCIALPAVKGCEKHLKELLSCSFLERTVEQHNTQLPKDTVQSTCAYHNLLHLTVLKKPFTDFKCLEISLISVRKLPWSSASGWMRPPIPPPGRCPCTSLPSPHQGAAPVPRRGAFVAPWTPGDTGLPLQSKTRWHTTAAM